ncbi:stage II sporulation protein D [Bacillus idriensis]|uniref:Stage II sporulation protein D n=1 Tax=Metabacillus idriensis TaxID=324768 RepID=A0A6I2M7Z5_9BACI|nr:stage II sporulation protein D [Metabacillus idriensis]MRX54228.1 stage II sporulation protein D [Metabacillus idriensis]
MKSWKPILLVLAGLFLIILMIPTLLVAPFMNQTKGELSEDLQAKKDEQVMLAKSIIDVPVYRSGSEKIENIPLEEYVIGVVASEMPADFEDEALKAQALAARTYIVKQLMSEQTISVPTGAVVSDTTAHQVFKSDAELKKQWGKDYDWKIKKVYNAVATTQGQILTYENKPIEASFFSTSNGYTENSEEYWAASLPYLKSVESPWDEKSPKYYDRIAIKVSDFEKKLGVTLDSDGEVGKVIERTSGKRVAQVDINGKKLNGREIREKLGLRSSDFTWQLKGDQVLITTKGFGHGVGMSQYGANFMAQDGKKYKDIVSYYYQGAQVANVEPFVTQFTARN